MARIGAALLFALTLSTAAASDAGAVVQGGSSAHHHFTVRLVGGAYCTGVVIGRRLVATAAHCGRKSVLFNGRIYAAAGIGKTAVLDDGRTVEVTGDAAILRLARDLPDARPAPVGPGIGDSFTIAGYGTTSERGGGVFGRLHEAWLVAAEPFALVHPEREGPISASACFGDSGGPVLRGGELVGIISRAAHPWPHIACGHLTRWAPITVSGQPATPVQIANVATYAGERPRVASARKRTPPGVEVSEISRPWWHLEEPAQRTSKMRRQ